MIRFVPDSWLDALLRPFLMADPVHSMYVEIAAPDWRFAALVVLLLVAWMGHRHRSWLQQNQASTLAGLVVCFAVWTQASGNGRYFIWGLLLVGPLVVLVARKLPASQFMRNAAIAAVLALQGVAIWFSYMPNAWSQLSWRAGPGLALDATALRNSPAVFLTLSAISYSALVPQMHPASRWASIAGQLDVQPGVREYPALLSLLDSPLPKYVVLRATSLRIGPGLQPTPKGRMSLARALARYDLALDDDPCRYVRGADAADALRRGQLDPKDEQGFWFCPAHRNGTLRPPDPAAAIPADTEAVFAQVERRCPRFFPPGNARSRQIAGAVQRGYNHSDTTLYVDDSGEVYFRNDRALNPTTVGPVDAVRRGDFKLDCTRLDGRYVPPWNRG